MLRNVQIGNVSCSVHYAVNLPFFIKEWHKAVIEILHNPFTINQQLYSLIFCMIRYTCCIYVPDLIKYFLIIEFRKYLFKKFSDNIISFSPYINNSFICQLYAHFFTRINTDGKRGTLHKTAYALFTFSEGMLTYFFIFYVSIRTYPFCNFSLFIFYWQGSYQYPMITG